MAPKASIIMRSKNSSWVIDQALAALAAQKFTDYELIVVDSGSTDTTLDIVKEYPCRLIQIEPQGYFPGSVLNMAIEKAQGEIMVFQNSDCVPLSEETLGHLMAAFDDSNVQAAFARQLPRPDADGWVRRDYATSFPDNENTPPWITYSLPLAAMRKSIWEQHKFYTDAWASEDTEWGHWAKTNGHQIKYVPKAIVMHSHNYTLKQLYGRRFVEGEADCFIYNEKQSIPKIIFKYFVSVARDFVEYLSAGDFLGAPIIPFRRFVFFWAHYKGHCLGESRKKSGNEDASIGQKVVLARHDSEDHKGKTEA